MPRFKKPIYFLLSFLGLCLLPAPLCAALEGNNDDEEVVEDAPNEEAAPANEGAEVPNEDENKEDDPPPPQPFDLVFFMQAKEKYMGALKDQNVTLEQINKARYMADVKKSRAKMSLLIRAYVNGNNKTNGALLDYAEEAKNLPLLLFILKNYDDETKPLTAATLNRIVRNFYGELNVQKVNQLMTYMPPNHETVKLVANGELSILKAVVERKQGKSEDANLLSQIINEKKADKVARFAELLKVVTPTQPVLHTGLHPKNYNRDIIILLLNEPNIAAMIDKNLFITLMGYTYKEDKDNKGVTNQALMDLLLAKKKPPKAILSTILEEPYCAYFPTFWAVYKNDCTDADKNFLIETLPRLYKNPKVKPKLVEFLLTKISATEGMVVPFINHEGYNFPTLQKLVGHFQAKNRTIRADALGVAIQKLSTDDKEPALTELLKISTATEETMKLILNPKYYNLPCLRRLLTKCERKQGSPLVYYSEVFQNNYGDKNAETQLEIVNTLVAANVFPNQAIIKLLLQKRKLNVALLPRLLDAAKDNNVNINYPELFDQMVEAKYKYEETYTDIAKILLTKKQFTKEELYAPLSKLIKTLPIFRMSLVKILVAEAQKIKPSFSFSVGLLTTTLTREYKLPLKRQLVAEVLKIVTPKQANMNFVLNKKFFDYAIFQLVCNALKPNNINNIPYNYKKVHTTDYKNQAPETLVSVLLGKLPLDQEPLVDVLGDALDNANRIKKNLLSIFYLLDFGQKKNFNLKNQVNLLTKALTRAYPNVEIRQKLLLKLLDYIEPQLEELDLAIETKDAVILEGFLERIAPTLEQLSTAILTKDNRIIKMIAEAYQKADQAHEDADILNHILRNHAEEGATLFPLLELKANPEIFQLGLATYQDAINSAAFKAFLQISTPTTNVLNGVLGRYGISMTKQVLLFCEVQPNLQTLLGTLAGDSSEEREAFAAYLLNKYEIKPTKQCLLMVLQKEYKSLLPLILKHVNYDIDSLRAALQKRDIGLAMLILQVVALDNAELLAVAFDIGVQNGESPTPLINLLLAMVNKLPQNVNVGPNQLQRAFNFINALGDDDPTPLIALMDAILGKFPNNVNVDNDHLASAFGVQEKLNAKSLIPFMDFIGKMVDKFPNNLNVEENQLANALALQAPLGNEDPTPLLRLIEKMVAKTAPDALGDSHFLQSFLHIKLPLGKNPVTFITIADTLIERLNGRLDNDQLLKNLLTIRLLDDTDPSLLITAAGKLGAKIKSNKVTADSCDLALQLPNGDDTQPKIALVTLLVKKLPRQDIKVEVPLFSEALALPLPKNRKAATKVEMLTKMVDKMKNKIISQASLLNVLSIPLAEDEDANLLITLTSQAINKLKNKLNDDQPIIKLLKLKASTQDANPKILLVKKMIAQLGNDVIPEPSLLQALQDGNGAIITPLFKAWEKKKAPPSLKLLKVLITIKNNKFNLFQRALTHYKTKPNNEILALFDLLFGDAYTPEERLPLLTLMIPKLSLASEDPFHWIFKNTGKLQVKKENNGNLFNRIGFAPKKEYSHFLILLDLMVECAKPKQLKAKTFGNIVATFISMKVAEGANENNEENKEPPKNIDSAADFKKEVFLKALPKIAEKEITKEILSKMIVQHTYFTVGDFTLLFPDEGNNISDKIRDGAVDVDMLLNLLTPEEKLYKELFPIFLKKYEEVEAKKEENKIKLLKATLTNIPNDKCEDKADNYTLISEWMGLSQKNLTLILEHYDQFQEEDVEDLEKIPVVYGLVLDLLEEKPNQIVVDKEVLKIAFDYSPYYRIDFIITCLLKHYKPNGKEEVVELVEYLMQSIGKNKEIDGDQHEINKATLIINYIEKIGGPTFEVFQIIVQYLPKLGAQQSDFLDTLFNRYKDENMVSLDTLALYLKQGGYVVGEGGERAFDTLLQRYLKHKDPQEDPSPIANVALTFEKIKADPPTQSHLLHKITTILGVNSQVITKVLKDGIVLAPYIDENADETEMIPILFKNHLWRKADWQVHLSPEERGQKKYRAIEYLLDEILFSAPRLNPEQQQRRDIALGAFFLYFVSKEEGAHFDEKTARKKMLSQFESFKNPNMKKYLLEFLEDKTPAEAMEWVTYILQTDALKNKISLLEKLFTVFLTKVNNEAKIKGYGTTLLRMMLNYIKEKGVGTSLFILLHNQFRKHKTGNLLDENEEVDYVDDVAWLTLILSAYEKLKEREKILKAFLKEAKIANFSAAYQSEKLEFIILSMRESDAELVEELLTFGFVPTLKHLNLAYEKGKDKICTLIEKKGVKPKASTLSRAMEAGKVAQVEKLMKNGLDPLPADLEKEKSNRKPNIALIQFLKTKGKIAKTYKVCTTQTVTEAVRTLNPTLLRYALDEGVLPGPEAVGLVSTMIKRGAMKSKNDLTAYYTHLNARDVIDQVLGAIGKKSTPTEIESALMVRYKKEKRHLLWKENKSKFIGIPTFFLFLITGLIVAKKYITNQQPEKKKKKAKPKEEMLAEKKKEKNRKKAKKKKRDRKS